MTSRRISIGTLSKETDIPVSTIRTWESRYGVPEASGRTKGNHRLYDVEVVEHLKLINQALQVNTRASEVVPLSIEELRKICCFVCGEVKDSEICAWLEYVRELDEGALHSAWQRSLNSLGLEQFILERMIPFVDLIGEEWRKGSMHVFEEHFVTEKILEFLSGVWYSINKHNVGEKIILASLPKETHILGLHFVACFLVLQGYKVIFLGTNLPKEEIARCADKTGAETLIFSISSTYDQEKAKEYLLELQEEISDFHRIIIGGKGAPKSLFPMLHCSDLSELIFLLNSPRS